VATANAHQVSPSVIANSVYVPMISVPKGSLRPMSSYRVAYSEGTSLLR
jgi:hypothetical protein